MTQSYFAVPKDMKLNTTLFCHKTSKPKRASTNCIQSFIIQSIVT